VLKYLEFLEGSTLMNPTAWYPSRQLGKVDDEDLIIADPYSHLQAVGADPAFLRHLPASLQHGLRAHFVLRRWILCHIVDPDLSLFQRQFRMVRALEIVELCRSRMANVVFGGQAEVQSRIVDPSLASFVERAVTSAIVSPESRLFSSAWHGVGITRKASAPDTLSAIVQSDLIATEATATLDLAWLQERLVEIATQVDSFTEGVSINFDKRRWLFNTVRNALAITPSQQASSFVGDPLAQMEKQLVGLGTWGVRILRDVASGEGTKLTKAAKPFHRLVAQQQEKSRRDKQTKDYVSKGLKIEQQGRMQREKDAAKGMDKTVNARARRMTSLFRAVRPTSTFVTAQQPPPPQSWPSPGAVQNLREWMPNSKPYLVLALSGVQVQPYDNSQRSFIFELSTEDGQRSLFQASSLDEMRMWISNFQKSGTQIAFRRATFLAQTALAEEDEPTQSQPFQTTTVASKGRESSSCPPPR
jgi:antitoxin (DNA-binding transcriptional repressor) of toxin-antitoxin stability system